MVVDNDSLSSLAGLSNIAFVGGDAQFNILPSLPSLAGLEALNEVGGILSVSDNDLLVDLTGLGNVRYAGEFTVWYNDGLTDLIGLDRLESVGEDVWIAANPVLESTRGAEALTTVGTDVLLQDNASLVDLSGFIGLVEGGMTIEGCPTLASLDGLANLSLVHGFKLVGTQVSTLSPLAGVTGNAEAIWIEDSQFLTDLHGLEGVTSASNSLILWGNTYLSDISALSSLTSVGNITITGNALSSLHGLEGVTLSRYSDVVVSNEDDLVDLDGFASFDVVEYLRVNDNPSLVDVSGLAALTEVYENAEFYDNASLCNADVLEEFSDVTIGGGLDLHNNGCAP